MCIKICRAPVWWPASMRSCTTQSTGEIQKPSGLIGSLIQRLESTDPWSGLFRLALGSEFVLETTLLKMNSTSSSRHFCKNSTLLIQHLTHLNLWQVLFWDVQTFHWRFMNAKRLPFLRLENFCSLNISKVLMFKNIFNHIFLQL